MFLVKGCDSCFSEEFIREVEQEFRVLRACCVVRCHWEG